MSGPGQQQFNPGNQRFTSGEELRVYLEGLDPDYVAYTDKLWRANYTSIRKLANADTAHLVQAGVVVADATDIVKASGAALAVATGAGAGPSGAGGAAGGLGAGGAAVSLGLEGDVNSLVDLISERVAGRVVHQLKPTHDDLAEEIRSWHSSGSIEASRIQDSTLETVRRLLKVSLQGDPATDAATVLHADAAGESDFSWDNTPEPAQRALYMQHIMEHVRLGQRNWEWTHQVTAKHLQLKGLGKQIAARSDELIVVRRFRNVPAAGCVLGIELKKRLSHASRRQAEAEFYTFGLVSNFPFVQVVTDMVRGGFAYYKSGEQEGLQIVQEKVLEGMDQVYGFLQQVFDSLPDNLGQEVGEGIVMPYRVQGRLSFMKVQDPVINSMQAPVLSVVDGDVGNEALGDLRPWFDQDQAPLFYYS